MRKVKLTKGAEIFAAELLESRRLCSYSPVGPEITVGSASSAEPVCAADSAGDFVVTWSASNGANGLDIYAQKYLAGGTPSGSPFLVNTANSGDQNDPTIAMNPSGDFVIGWSSVYGSNGAYLLYCQAFSPNCTPLEPQVLVTPTIATTSPTGPQLAIGPSGEFEAAYVIVSGNTSTLEVQRYTSAGVATGPLIQVQQAAALTIASSASDSNGDLALAWINSSGQTYLNEYSVTGNSLVAQTLLPFSYLHSSLAIDSEGDIAVSWATPDGNNYDLNAEEFRNFGSVEESSFVVQAYVAETSIVTSAGDYSLLPSAIAMDGNGDIQVGVAVSTSAFNGTSFMSETDLLTRTYTASGTFINQLQTTGGIGTVRDFPSLCDDAAGDFILVDSANAAAFGGVIHAQVFQAFSSTATITGNIWNDSNANGIDDPSEASASVKSVNLYNSYGVLIAKVTNPSGSYSFTQVMPGQPVYVQVVPVSTIVSYSTGPVEVSAGLITLQNVGGNPAIDSVFDQTTGIGPILTLSAGQLVGNQNVGVITSATITGTVFNDLLGTGVKDSADALVAGQIVYADLNQNETLDPGEPSASSNGIANPGQFNLFLLRPGTYSIAVQPETGWITPAEQTVTVAAGQTVTMSIGLSESSVGVPPTVTGSPTTLAKGILSPWVAENDSGSTVEVYSGPYPSYNKYFQLYGANGAAIGGPTQLNSINSAFLIDGVGIAQDGSFVILAQSTAGLSAQCFSSSGVATTGLLNIDSNGNDSSGSLSVNASGEFTIAWDLPNYSVSTCAIDAMSFSPGGTPAGTTNLVATIPFPSGSQLSLSVKNRSDGGSVVVWDYRPPSGTPAYNDTSIYAQWLDATAEPIGSEVTISQASSDDSYAGAAINGAGELAIVWQGYSAGQNGVYIQRYSPGGATLGNPTLVLSAVYTQGVEKYLSVDTRGDVTGISYSTASSQFTGIYLDENGAASQFTVPAAATSYNYQDTAFAGNSLGDLVFMYGIGGSSASYEMRFQSSPVVLDSIMQASTASTQMVLRLSEDVSGFPSPAQINIQDLTTGLQVPSSVYSVVAATNATLTINLPGLTSGNYLIDVPAADVSTSAGRDLSTDFTFRWLLVTPTAAADAVTVRKSSDGTTLQVFDDIPEGSNPTYSASLTGLNQLIILGGPGNDSLTFDFSNGSPKVPLSYDGSGGNNDISIVGAIAGYSVTETTNSLAVGSELVSYANVQTVIMNPGAGTDSINVSGGATLVIPAAPSGGGITLLQVSSLKIGTGSTLRIVANTNTAGAIDHADRVVFFISTSFTMQGAFDTGDNDLIYNSLYGTSLSSLDQLIWGGNGSAEVFSSASSPLATLGAEPASGASFDGQPTSSYENVVKYTYYGDANLDGKVDGSDYTRIDNGYLNSLTGWFNGDFNYDGVVNGSDYTLIDNAFNTQGANLSAELAPPGKTAVSRATRPAALFSQVQVTSPTASQCGAAIAVASIADDLFGIDPAELRSVLYKAADVIGGKTSDRR